MPRVPSRLRRWAATLSRELAVLAIAYRDPRTPLVARATVVAVLAYALSPLDLIPDAIPVVGLLDDLVLVPLGIALSLRLLPPEVVRDARVIALRAPHGALPARLGRWGALSVLALWAIALAALACWLLPPRWR